MAEWFLRLGESSLGPYSSKQFAAMAIDGRLAPTDSIRRGDMTSWVPAAKLQGLSFPPELPPPSPPVTPEPPSQASNLAPRTTADRLLIKWVNILGAIRRRPSFAVLGAVLIASIATVQWPFGAAGARATRDDNRTAKPSAPLPPADQYGAMPTRNDNRFESETRTTSSKAPVSSPVDDNVYVIRSGFSHAIIQDFRVGNDGLLYDLTTLFYVEDGTTCREDVALVGNDRFVRNTHARVTILDGIYRGKSGWIVRKWLR